MVFSILPQSLVVVYVTLSSVLFVVGPFAAVFPYFLQLPVLFFPMFNDLFPASDGFFAGCGCPVAAL